MRLRRHSKAYPTEPRSESSLHRAPESAEAIASICRDMAAHLAQLISALDEPQHRNGHQMSTEMPFPALECSLVSPPAQARRRSAKGLPHDLSLDTLVGGAQKRSFLDDTTRASCTDLAIQKEARTMEVHR